MGKGTKKKVVSSKTVARKKARDFLKKVKKGQHAKRKHRVYTNPRFFKPKTLMKQNLLKMPKV